MWAGENGVHPWVTDYLVDRPDHLWSQPPKTEEPFSTPRSWHMLSDALHSFGPEIDEETLKVVVHGTLTPAHAVSFCGYAKIVRHAFGIEAILKGDASWPGRPEDRDLLYYLADAFRGRLVKELPRQKEHVSPSLRQTAYRAKSLLVQLAEISVEVAQTVIADDADGLPVLAGVVPRGRRAGHAPAGRGPAVKGPHGRRGGGKGGKSTADPATEAFAAGLALVKRNPAFAAVAASVCRQDKCALAPAGGMAAVTSNGTIHVHPTRRADPAEWAWVLAHCLLHLGFGHVPASADEPRVQPDRFDLAARCTVVNRFLLTHPIGTPPAALPESFPGGDEELLAARWRRDGIPVALEHCGTAGEHPDQVLTTWNAWNNAAVPDWETAFAHALTRSVSAAMDVAGGRRDRDTGELAPQRPWDRALNWFVSSYPLLGGLAAGLKIVADAEVARTHGIAIAAVSAVAGEIYINPLRGFTDEEWRFVLAHEMLHAALRHGERRGGRDPFLFNVAADYVVNDWLIQMRVGDMPEGLLYDPDLRGLSAEEVYDRIAHDLRRRRRLATLRGKGAGDILGEPLPHALHPAVHGPGRVLPARADAGLRPAPVRGARPPARRADPGDPRPVAPARAVGRAAGPLVRRVRPPAGARTLLRAPGTAAGLDPRHPACREVLPAPGDGPLHLRRRP